MEEKTMSLREAVSLVEDGSSLGIATSAPMAIVREIIRQGKKDLTLYPAIAGMESDMLIGAGCVRDVHYQRFGPAPNFRRAAESGLIKAREQSDLTTLFGVLAGAMGLPFVPLRGFFNDHIKHHPEWRTFPSPFDGKELLAIAPVIPDVTIIHVPKADKFGNAQLEDTVRYNVMLEFCATRMVEAARKVIVSAEEIIPEEEIRKDPWKTSFVYREVNSVVHAPHGAHPYGLRGYYAADDAHIREYFQTASNADSFQEYLVKYVREPGDHNAYLRMVGVL